MAFRSRSLFGCVGYTFGFASKGAFLIHLVNFTEYTCYMLI